MPKNREHVEHRDPTAPATGQGPVPISPKGRRLTIAFVADYMSHFTGAYETQFRNAFAAQCRDLDINLLLVYGGAFGHPSASNAAQNAIFDLMHPDRVDGVVLLSTSLSSFAGPQKVRELVSRLGGLPCCSLGIALEGVPSVVIDNRASMEAIVEHVVTVHGGKRIAFMAGTRDNPEAQVRHATFLEVLRRHGLPIDPALIEHGNFWTRGAWDAMRKILALGVAFDALICANDAMAQAVVGVLAEHDIRVPRDVILTGFDDVYGSNLMTPPLTTAAQPFEAMASAAIRSVLDQIQGKAVPVLTELEAKLVVRRSCGCNRRARRAIAPERADAKVTMLDYLREAHERIEARLRAELSPIPTCGSDCAAQLLHTLASELLEQSGLFLEQIEVIASDTSHSPEQVLCLQRAIASLREELSQFAPQGCDDLWHEARDVIELAIVRGQLNRRLGFENSYLRLLETSEEVSRALNRESFRATLAKSLPSLGIRSAAISSFVDGNMEELELMAGLVDQTLKEDVRARFPARQLLPAELYPNDRRHTSLVLPLVLEAERLGVAVFEYNGEALGQLMVSPQISAAMSSIHLHQELIEKSVQSERSMQERLATTKRLEALSVLAGGVAHDLNNALGPLVALPDVILEDLDSVVNQGDITELRRDVETVKLAALRAAQTIKDLLTLGRQGRTAKEPLDLAQLISSCANSDLLQVVRAKNPLVKLRVEVSTTPLVIHASEAHIVRALSNLVHNAAEAIPNEGEVVVRVSSTNLTTPVQGFESVEPGEYAMVLVSDNGRGMPAQDLHRIFEPFFSKKRTGDLSGSGLGLAIVHSVVKEHDGFIDVTSQLGVGSRFTLYFPKSDVMAFDKTKKATAHGQGRGRILIVDDEPIQLRTCKRVLQRLGYDVDTLESGRLACERFLQAMKAGRSPYDLVILDMVLNEDADGLERFEQIRQLFPRQRAIVVSGHAPTERAEAAFQKGLAWLAKPYTAEALVSAVELALAERESMGSLRISCRPSSAPPRRPTP